MSREEFNVLYAIQKYGVSHYTKAEWLSTMNSHLKEEIFSRFLKNEWVDSKGITEKGMLALKPYKVENALIMAAGMSSRFMPLSLEKPKGLLPIKGEVLIERQIEQLLEAGVSHIVIVLGYKKEEFYYLMEKYKDKVTFIVNDDYAMKNNTHTLFLAQEELANTYICSSDNYFSKNPFDEYVYESYYSAIHVEHPTKEWYMTKDRDSHLCGVQVGGEDGDIMLGHAYWNRDFSRQMVKYLNQDKEKYDSLLWETILKDHFSELPPMEVKVYPKDVIFEFDSLDELREFDVEYQNHSGSQILENIRGVFGCEEKDIKNFKPISFAEEGYAFSFEVEGEKFLYSYFDSDEDIIFSNDHVLRIKVPSWKKGKDEEKHYLV